MPLLLLLLLLEHQHRRPVQQCLQEGGSTSLPETHSRLHHRSRLCLHRQADDAAGQVTAPGSIVLLLPLLLPLPQMQPQVALEDGLLPLRLLLTSISRSPRCLCCWASATSVALLPSTTCCHSLLYVSHHKPPTTETPSRSCSHHNSTP